MMIRRLGLPNTINKHTQKDLIKESLVLGKIALSADIYNTDNLRCRVMKKLLEPILIIHLTILSYNKISLDQRQ